MSKWPLDFVEHYTLPPLQSSCTEPTTNVNSHSKDVTMRTISRLAEPYQESGNKNDSCKDLRIALSQIARGKILMK